MQILYKGRVMNDFIALPFLFFDLCKHFLLGLTNFPIYGILYTNIFIKSIILNY